MTMPSEILTQLSRGDETALTSSLRPVLAQLREHGFQVVDIHVDALQTGAFEVIVDRPIPRELASSVRLPEGVEAYEDYNQHDSFVGIGFISTAANQCISGRWPD